MISTIHIEDDEEDDSPYEKGDILRSFHHQARQPMSRKALLAGFLSVWLMRCVMPSPSGDIILQTVLLPAVRLVHGHSLGLMPTMVCCIQRGLRALTEAFCRPPNDEEGKRYYPALRRTKSQDRPTIHLFDGMVRSSLPCYYSSW